MKKSIITFSFLALLGGVGKFGFVFWQDNMSKAISAATATIAAKQKLEVAKLKSKHKSELAQLRKKNTKKINKLIRKHKGELAKAKTKERAKAKVQRAFSAIPLMGVGAFALFEKLEFENWKVEHPDGTFEQYSIEIGDEVNQILQAEYREYYQQYRELFLDFNQ